MSGSYVMGIDFGTESVRVGLFAPDGTPAAFGSQSYSVNFPRPGWAEQSPDEWWDALGKAVRQVLGTSRIPPAAIAGIGTDTTSCTIVVLDGQFRPLRPAIIWMDMRATAQARRIERGGHPALRYNGDGPVSAEPLPCKALWLKENQPEIYHRAHYICECEDWLTYRLTGRYTASVNTAAVFCYHDRDVGGWQPDFLDTIGLGDLLDKMPADVLDMGTVTGGLTPEAAEHLGLAAGTPVAQGGCDGFVAQIGLDVIAPGKIAFITGSSHSLGGQSAMRLRARGLTGPHTDAVIPGLYTIEASQASSGSILKWFKDCFCGDWTAEAAAAGVDFYDVLNARAAAIPPGSEGLVVLEHWQGNRSPYTDPESRGAIWGFSLRHTPAHVARAIMEGVAYGTEQNLSLFRENRYDVNELAICGGVTNSPLWMQIHADVSNTPIVLTEGAAVAATLGAAILGAVAGGVYRSVPEATAEMVHVAGRVEPDKEAHEAYRFYFDKYCETYPAMKDLLHQMVRHVAGRD